MAITRNFDPVNFMKNTIQTAGSIIKYFKTFDYCNTIDKKRLDILLWFVLITIIYLIIWFDSDYTLVTSPGNSIPLIFIVFTGSFTNVVISLASLPGGLGVREKVRIIKWRLDPSQFTPERDK